MNFFTPKDFHEIASAHDGRLISDIANVKLAKHGVLVFGSNAVGWTISRNTYDRQKAILINIEPIQKCEHPKDEVTRLDFYDHGPSKDIYQTSYKCQCGATVYPNSFSEEK